MEETNQSEYFISDILKRNNTFDKKNTSILHFKKNESIFQQEAPCFGVYSIISGTAKIYSTEVNGKEVIHQFATEGDIIGLSCVFGHRKHTFGAKAIDNLSCCFIELQDFYEILRKDHELMDLLLKKVGHELESSYTKRSQLIRMSVRQRLAEYLKEMCARHGSLNEQGIRINMRLTREEIASVLGTANETAIRFISEFKEIGLLEEHDKYLLVKDASALDQIINQN